MYTNINSLYLNFLGLQVCHENNCQGMHFAMAKEGWTIVGGGYITESQPRECCVLPGLFPEHSLLPHRDGVLSGENFVRPRGGTQNIARKPYTSIIQAGEEK